MASAVKEGGTSSPKAAKATRTDALKEFLGRSRRIEVDPSTVELTPVRRAEVVALGELADSQYDEHQDPIGYRDDVGELRIIDGMRRVLLARERRVKTIGVQDLGKLPLDRVIELCLRTDIANKRRDPVETARLIAGYAKAHSDLSERDIASALGISHTYVGQLLAVNELPETIHGFLSGRILSLSHARVLAKAGLETVELLHLAEKVIEEGISAAALERLIADRRGANEASDAPHQGFPLEKPGDAGLNAGNELPVEERKKASPRLKVVLAGSRLTPRSGASVVEWLKDRWPRVDQAVQTEMFERLTELVNEWAKKRAEGEGHVAQ